MNKLLISLGILLAIALLTISTLEIIRSNEEIETNNNLISLPEEISLAKKGDILIVESVSDSIYIGFKRYPLEWKIYALDLEEQGYTKQASEHIAKVEFNIIPVDKEYISLMED